MSLNESDSDSYNDDNIGDTTAEDETPRRRLVMIKAYSDNIGQLHQDNTMRSINRVLRQMVLPKMKFLDNTNKFGSFNRPDFTDTNSWVSKLFAKIPALDRATDRTKCQVWITYKAKIKEQFGLHRSSVTLKIKRAMIAGKKICGCCLISLTQNYPKLTMQLYYA